MDVDNLARRLGIEVNELLASRGAGSLLVVGSQTGKQRVCAGSDTVALVNSLGLVGGVVLLVQVLEGGEEAVGNAVLAVEVDGTLGGLVTNAVAVSEVLSNDARAGLLLLGELIAVALGLALVVAGIVIGRSAGARDLDVCATELSVVEEKGGLGSSLLLEGDGGLLGVAGLLDLEVGDLAAVGAVSSEDVGGGWQVTRS